mmetsp:Transcript_53880/g.165791  ORF Transcript_53880/g.165791 Transcript_53880/m.165791 type:complete len:404 (+) Transcript_53880:1340-2551(+)
MGQLLAAAATPAVGQHGACVGRVQLRGEVEIVHVGGALCGEHRLRDEGADAAQLLVHRFERILQVAHLRHGARRHWLRLVVEHVGRRRHAVGHRRQRREQHRDQHEDDDRGDDEDGARDADGGVAAGDDIADDVGLGHEQPELDADAAETERHGRRRDEEDVAVSLHDVHCSRRRVRQRAVRQKHRQRAVTIVGRVRATDTEHLRLARDGLGGGAPGGREAAGRDAGRHGEGRRHRGPHHVSVAVGGEGLRVRRRAGAVEEIFEVVEINDRDGEPVDVVEIRRVAAPKQGADEGNVILHDAIVFGRVHTDGETAAAAARGQCNVVAPERVADELLRDVLRYHRRPPRVGRRQLREVGGRVGTLHRREESLLRGVAAGSGDGRGTAVAQLEERRRGSSRSVGLR